MQKAKLHIVHILTILVVFCFLLPKKTSAQSDTSNAGKTFDFGFTRDKNINLWPVFKRTIDKGNKDIEVFFPLIRYQFNKTTLERQTRVLPFYIGSSEPGEYDKRFLSLYYPSVLHITKDSVLQTSSFKFMEFAPKVSLLEISRSKDGLFVDNNFLFLLWYKNDIKYKQSHLVFFPLYWSFRDNDKVNRTFFPLVFQGSNPAYKKSYLGITPFYWHLKNNGQTRDVLFPLYWSRKSETINNKVLFPLIWSYKNQYSKSFTFLPLFSVGGSTDGSRKYAMVTPLFWHLSNGSNKANVLFPLYWNFQNGTGDNVSKTNVFFPLFWSVRDKYRENTVLLPLFYKFKSPQYSSITFLPLFSRGHSSDSTDTHLMITPLFWHFKFGNNTSNILFPIVWNFNKPEYRSFTFFPLFSTGSSKIYDNSHLMLTPFFWHFKKQDETRNILFPIWWNKRRGSGENARVSNVVFPVFWSYTDRESTSKVLFPFIYRFKDPKYSSFTFFPFMSVGSSPDKYKSHMAVTPLFWKFNKGNTTINTLLPLFWDVHVKHAEYPQNFTMLFPLFFNYYDNETQSSVLFPIHWSFNFRNYQSYTFFPLFSQGQSKDGSRKYLMLTPLFWHREKAGLTRNVLFPIWWYKKVQYTDYQKISNVVFPLYFAYKDYRIDNKVLFPLFWKLKDDRYSSLTIFPLFSKGVSADSTRRHLMLTPLFWSFTNAEGTARIIFPFWWEKSKGKGEEARYSNMFFLLYWSYKDANRNNKVLFPFVWSFKNQHRQNFTLFPLLSFGKRLDSDSRYFAATPLFWHTSSSNGYRNILFPLLWNKKVGVGDEAKYTTNILPLYFSSHDKDHDKKILFPFVWSFRDRDWYSFTFFPLVSYGQSTDKSRVRLMATPLFWHTKKYDKERYVLFPLWWYRKSGEGANQTVSNVIFPLFWHKKSQFETASVLFPIVWSLKDQEKSSFTVLPLFSYGESRDGQRRQLMVTPLFWHLKNGDSTRDILFPLWWHRVKGSGENRQVSNVVFPLYWSFRDANVNNKFFLPLFYKTENREYKSITFFPLVSFGKSKLTEKTHLMATPLFWHFSNKENHTNILFPLFWNFKRGNGEQARKTNILFPILWSFKNQNSHSFTLIPLVSFGKSVPEGRSHLMVSPLFWDIKRPGWHAVTLFPLFRYTADTSGNKRFSLLYFLGRFSKLNNGYSASLLWPLIHAEKAGNTSKFRIAPIIWYKNSPEGGHFSIQPFFYRGRDKNMVSNYFLWQLFTHKNIFNEKKSTGFLWKTVFYDKYYNGDHEFRVLYYLFSDANVKGSVEKSFFPFYYYTKKPNGDKSLGVFFYFYSSIKKQIEGTNEFYEEEKLFWFLRFRSNFKTLKAKGIDVNLK